MEPETRFPVEHLPAVAPSNDPSWREGNALIKALKRSDAADRARAARAMGVAGYPRFVGPLIGAMGDEDDAVRLSAAEALGRIGDGRALEALTVALVDGDDTARRGAASALAERGDAAVELVLDALKDRDGPARQGALSALRGAGGAAAAEAVTAALGGYDQESCDVCAKTRAPRARYRSYPPLSVQVTDMGAQIHTEMRYSPQSFEEMTICDACLEERRAKSWWFWVGILVASIPIVPFLFGIFGVAIAASMLFSLHRGNKGGVGDMIVARDKQNPGKRKLLGIENEWKTRRELEELTPHLS